MVHYDWMPLPTLKTPSCLCKATVNRQIQTYACTALPQIPSTAIEKGDRAEEGKHRGLDSAIYKAWLFAHLINCALFWERRKWAELQQRER